MKSPLNSFVNALEQLDPLLSVRWGQVINSWVIERKAYVPASEIVFLERRAQRAKANLEENPQDKSRALMLKEIQEEYASAKTGRRVVLYAQNLDNRVFNNLVAADMAKYGGYVRFADELEKQEQEEKERKEKKYFSDLHELNREVYDVMSWMHRRKETEIENGRSRELMREAFKLEKPGKRPAKKYVNEEEKKPRIFIARS